MNVIGLEDPSPRVARGKPFSSENRLGVNFVRAILLCKQSLEKGKCSEFDEMRTRIILEEALVFIGSIFLSRLPGWRVEFVLIFLCKV